MITAPSSLLPVRVAMLCLIGNVVACATLSEPDTVTRTVGGERRVGAFIPPFSYEWYVRGELAFARRDFRSAEEAFRMALAAPEEDSFVMARLADTLDRLGKPDDANDVLAEALRAEPWSEAAWLVQGELAERHGNRLLAIHAYEKAEVSAPLEPRGPLALAHLLRRMGANARADAVLARYIERAGGGSAEAARARLAIAISRRDGAAASAAVDALLQVAPAKTAEIRAAAETALASGDPGLATRLLEHMPRRSSDDTLRIQALLAAGRHRDAERLLSMTSPDVLGGVLAVARLYLLVGRAARAEELAAAAGASGSGPKGKLLLGEAQLIQGKYAAAAESFASVPRGVPGYAQACVFLSDTLSAQTLAALAREVLEGCLRKGTDDELLVRRALAENRFRAGDLLNALAVLEVLKTPSATATRAHLLERAGRLKDAMALYAALPPTEPTLEPQVRARAAAEHYAARGNPIAAAIAMGPWATQNPQDILTQVRWAELLAASGKRAKAHEVADATLQVTVQPALRERLSAVLKDAPDPRR